MGSIELQAVGMARKRDALVYHFLLGKSNSAERGDLCLPSSMTRLARGLLTLGMIGATNGLVPHYNRENKTYRTNRKREKRGRVVGGMKKESRGKM